VLNSGFVGDEIGWVLPFRFSVVERMDVGVGFSVVENMDVGVGVRVWLELCSN
jgi:hypothetical protein